MDLGKFGVEVKDDSKPKAIEDSKLEINFEEMRSELNFEEIERYLPWFLKYQIKSFDDLIITSEIKKMLEFIENFKPGKGLMLAGSAGSGKTTTLNLLGEHFGFEIFELNASDARNKNSIEESVGVAIKQKSLFGKEKLILIDEVDGVSGTKDRGGAAQLTKLIKTSKYPMVFTANDKESDKIKAIKKQCIFIDFENHSYELLINIAKRIFEKENIGYEKNDLELFIEERATFDIRGFINDLQSSVYDSKFDPSSDLEIRDYKKKIEGLLNKVFYSYPEDSYFSGFNTDINIDELFLYLEENIPNIYSKKSLISAFNELSKADVFRGRIRKWQYWRFLVYINFYLTFGVSNVKDESVSKVKEYKRNGRILKKWIYNNKVSSLSARTKIQKSNDDPEKFVEKLAKIYGRSANRTRKEDIKYFAFMYANSEKFREQIDSDEELGIDESVKKSLLDI